VHLPKKNTKHANNAGTAVVLCVFGLPAGPRNLTVSAAGGNGTFFSAVPARVVAGFVTISNATSNGTATALVNATGGA
jgi:hypothetical protein